LAEAFDCAYARLLFAADALAKETAPPGEYVGPRKRGKPAKRGRAVQ
jgi:hypothetical protein